MSKRQNSGCAVGVAILLAQLVIVALGTIGLLYLVGAFD